MEVNDLPDFFDPDSAGRETFRRYRNRRRLAQNDAASFEDVYASKLPEASYLHNGDVNQRPRNGALLVEGIKLEADNLELDVLEGASSRERRASIEGLRPVKDEDTAELDQPSGSLLQASHRLEDESLNDGAEIAHGLFASLLDSYEQGLLPISDLILRFEKACREVAESITYGSAEKHRIFESKLLSRKSKLLLDEAASWSLIWHLFGKGKEEVSEVLKLSPTTSHLAACGFVHDDHNAQLCLRIVQWLEGIASIALEMDNKVRGCHVGSYLPSSGVWHHTQRLLKKKRMDSFIIQHLDFDAQTREMAQILPDDKKQDESLLEDVWVLLKAGRLEEACEICRSAGQSWRAATICPFGGIDHFPSLDALTRNGINRTLQAIELESGIGHQWRLWRWACYCASEKIAQHDGGRFEVAVYAALSSNLKRLLPICMDWETACWAIAKSWLDTQVDFDLARSESGRMEQLKSYADAIDGIGKDEETLPTAMGSEGWPYHVLDQQPRDLFSLLQKLHSSDIVHEAVCRQCKEQHRQVEMNLMLGDIETMLDLIWSWVSPLDDDCLSRHHGDPQMMRFGAHLVLILRYLHANEVGDFFIDKLLSVGDRILHIYAMFLFSKEHEELVGIYASQLAPHRCTNLFVHMMETKLKSSYQVKHKLFKSAIEYLPFSNEDDDTKASFEDIIARVLEGSRNIKLDGHFKRFSAVTDLHLFTSLQKAEAVQWLCFTPPSTLNNSKLISFKLLWKALMHSNLLLREFAFMSMWRISKMPVAAHKLFSFLAEPLKQLTEEIGEELEISENLREFEEWREYYSCDALYRKWLELASEISEVRPNDLSVEERENVVAAAKESLRACLSFLLREDRLWLNAAHGSLHDSLNPPYIELRATVMLSLPSGDYIAPDAAFCSILTSSLYSTVSEEVILKRKLVVSVSLKDCLSVEVVLRCLAVDGDGIGLHMENDGGLLAAIMAAGSKGDLTLSQAGLALEIFRLDAWFTEADGRLGVVPATYIVQGLCRRCCLPEIILRCMQVSVSLSSFGSPPDEHDKLIELAASPEFEFCLLFTQRQLREFLFLEREYSIFNMELQEEHFNLFEY